MSFKLSLVTVILYYHCFAYSKKKKVKEIILVL